MNESAYVPDPREPTTYDELPGGDLGSGNGGTTTTVTGFRQVYMDRAPADPDDVSIEAVSYDSQTGSLQHWNINTLAWQ